MGMVVQHNLPAINSHRQLGINNNSLSKSLEKLSSGFRINRAADDAAGLAISEKMRGQISGLTKASENSQDGISLIQTAEGALTETHSILQRMRELAVQSSNGTYQNEVDRENIDEEVKALKSEIDRISTSTHYNGIQLLDGSMQGARITSVDGAPRDPSGNVTGVSTPYASDYKAGEFASFSVDLKDVTGVENGKTYDITVGGVKVESAATAANTTAGLATAFNGKKLTIDGVEFTAANNGTKLTFTAAGAANMKEAPSLKGGLDVKITSGATTAPTTVPGGSGGSTTMIAAGASATVSNSDVSIRDTVEEGTTFTIGGKTYQVVNEGTTLKDGTKITNGMNMDNMNAAIVVNMNEADRGRHVAEQLVAALNQADSAGPNPLPGVAGGHAANASIDAAAAAGKYTATSDGNTVKITSALDAAGVDVNANALKITTSGPIKAASTAIDVKNVEYGMTFNVNGKNYEVVKDANDVREDNNIAVVVSDINKFNSKTVADALFNKIKEDTNLKDSFDVVRVANSSSITITEKAPTGDTKAVSATAANAGVTFQIGANGKADQKVSLQVDDMGSSNLGIKNKYGNTTKSIQDINVGTRNSANESIEVIDAAINQVSGTRANMGALQNRLEHTIKNLDVAAENLTAAESRIRDVDMAKEMMNFSKSQILSQASQAMLAQANTLPQGVLQLLQ